MKKAAKNVKSHAPKKKANPARIKSTPKKSTRKKVVQKASVLPPVPAQDSYEEIKAVLLQQKKTLLAEAGVLLENTLNPSSEVFPDATDQASAETDQNFILRLREREQQLLVKIDDAIERIHSGTFGICEMCGEQIAFKRLKARPVTTFCIECKTKQELDEKLRQD